MQTSPPPSPWTCFRPAKLGGGCTALCLPSAKTASQNRLSGECEPIVENHTTSCLAANCNQPLLFYFPRYCLPAPRPLLPQCFFSSRPGRLWAPWKGQSGVTHAHMVHEHARRPVQVLTEARPSFFPLGASPSLRLCVSWRNTGSLQESVSEPCWQMRSFPLCLIRCRCFVRR